MGRPRGEPTTVLRLPTQLVERIDGQRGEESRAAYLEALVQRDDIDGPVSRSGLPRHGSPSPSLERFR